MTIPTTEPNAATERAGSKRVTKGGRFDAPMPASTAPGRPSAEAMAYANALWIRPGGPDRWEPSRLTVCNWWHFAYQEFLVIDGHLVLTGNNGSGKSSVAAAAVPVALDMLKHRRRFDPFGADARDPKDLLIGKWDASPNSDEYHDDRTGYIIWEFRHRRTGERVTCGVGFRARRALGPQGEVEHWGFVVPTFEHGRDFSIFAASDEPIGRRELKERLGDAHVFQAPKDYQRAVNDALYGFERPERLKELMDVLVELRKPKLQKAPTPETLSESLSAALPPLANAVTEQLSTLVASINAALEAVQRTRDHVSRVERLDRAQGDYEFLNAQVHAVDVLDAHRAGEAARRDLNTAHETRRALAAQRDDVEAKVQVRGEERATAHAAIEVLQLREEFQQIGSYQKSVTDLDTSERELKRARDVTGAARKRLEENEAQRDRLAFALRAAIGEIEASFDDLDDASLLTKWKAVAPRLAAAREALAGVTLQTPDGDPQPVVQQLGLSDLRALWVARQGDLERAIAAAELLAEVKRAYEQAELQLANVKTALDAAQATARDARNANEEALEALPDALEAWAHAQPRTEIHGLLDGALVALRTMIDTGQTLTTEGTPRPGAELVRPMVQALDAAAEESHDAMRSHIETRADLLVQRTAHETERATLEAAPFVPPPERPGQRALREALEAYDIPIVPLYMAVDLAPGSDPAKGARIERVLEDAGLLDALLVTPSTRDRLAALIASGDLPATAADRWIVGLPADQTDPTGAATRGARTSAATEAPRSSESLLVGASDQLPADVLTAIVDRVIGVVDTAKTGQDANRFGSTPVAAPAVSGTESESLSPSVISSGRWQHGVIEGWVGVGSAHASPRYLGAENRLRTREARLAQLNAAIERLSDSIDREDEAIALQQQRTKGLRAAAREVTSVMTVSMYEDTRQQRVVSAQNADRLNKEFSRQDLETQRARMAVKDQQRILDGALTPLPECRGMSGHEMRELLPVTRTLLKDLTRVTSDIDKLNDYRTRDVELANSARIERTQIDDAVEHERLATNEVASRRATRDQIQRLIESPDVQRLQADLAREKQRESGAQKALDTLQPERGRLKAKVEEAEHEEQRCADLCVTRDAALDQQAAGLRTAVVRYPQPDLAQAATILEAAGEQGGPVAAARDLLRRRRAVADMRRNVTADRDQAFRQLTVVFEAEKNPLAVYRPEFSDADVQVRLVEHRETRQVNAHDLHVALTQTLVEQERVATAQENELYEKYFLGDVSAKVRERIAEAQALVKEIGATLQQMTLSNGTHFSLAWQAKSGGVAGPEYTRLVRLVQWDPDAMTAATRSEMIDLFRSTSGRASAHRSAPEGHRVAGGPVAEGARLPRVVRVQADVRSSRWLTDGAREERHQQVVGRRADARAGATATRGGAHVFAERPSGCAQARLLRRSLRRGRSREHGEHAPHSS